MQLNINNFEKNRLYGELSHLYPYVIIREDYKGEVDFWKSLLSKINKNRRTKLLEMGSGPGYLISYLSDECDIDVVDLSAEMLTQCKQLNPSITCYQGDMITVRLENSYDVVLVHDGIGHIGKEKDIYDVCLTANAHLEQVGVFLLSPEFDESEFDEPIVYHVTRSTPLGFLTIIDYINKSPLEANELQTITSYILENESGTTIEFDRMTLGLFSENFYKSIMEKAGFDVTIKVKPENSSGETRKVFIGVKK